MHMRHVPGVDAYVSGVGVHASGVVLTFSSL